MEVDLTAGGSRRRNMVGCLHTKLRSLEILSRSKCFIKDSMDGPLADLYQGYDLDGDLCGRGGPHSPSEQGGLETFHGIVHITKEIIQKILVEGIRKKSIFDTYWSLLHIHEWGLGEALVDLAYISNLG